MKRLILIAVVLLLVCSICACGQIAPSKSAEPTQTPDKTSEQSAPVSATEPTDALNEAAITDETVENSEMPDPTEDETMILVAYFSRTGNTETVAHEISEQTGGELFEIVPEEPYPDDYDATVERYRQEDAEDARPAIASTVDNMDEYDIVFVGYPNWGSDMPHVVMSFLEQYDFSGKTVIPFCTHGGGGFGRSIQTLEELCPDSTILDGFHVSGSSAENRLDEVAAWLNGLDY